MVGIEGGFMAIIHLILKRPIIGVCAAASLIGAELNGYPVFDSAIASVRETCLAIGNAPEGMDKILERGLIRLSERRNRQLAAGLEGSSPYRRLRPTGKTPEVLRYEFLPREFAEE